MIEYISAKTIVTRTKASGSWFLEIARKPAGDRLRPDLFPEAADIARRVAPE